MNDASVQRIAESQPDACWLYAPRDGRFTFVNSVFVRRWGGSADDPFNAAQRWLQRLHRDDRPAVHLALEGLARGEDYAIEYRAYDEGGGLLWIAEHACFIGTADGLGRQALGISRDITAYKRTELALQHASRCKDEFLAILMHELRAPLQSILAASQTLPKPHSGPARVIARQVHNLARLIDDMSESSRVARNKVHLRLQTVDLRDVVREAIEAQQVAFEGRGLRLRTQVPADAVWVQADPARLAQVFNNLLHNAAKFSAEGGAVEVCIAQAAATPLASVSVRDEGVGIAPDVLGTVFELFAQGGGMPGPQRGGLGIGLPVVRSLVELHGGRVTAHSEGSGKGSCFVVTLTAVPAPVRSMLRRILIVDDNADAATSLQQLLEMDGHAVMMAFDGRSALERAERWKPDTVILDLHLPDLDRREVARGIHAAATGRGPRLIALSGAADIDRDAMQRAGFDHCLTKPARLAELAAALA